MQTRATLLTPAARPRGVDQRTAAAKPPALLSAAATLTRAAAKVLGLGDADAATVGDSGLISIAGKRVMLIPLAEGGTEQELGFLISVHTGSRMDAEGSTAPLAVLQHTPGALLSFNAAVGVSPDGEWLLHRHLRVGADGAQALAEATMACVQLAEFMLDAGSANQG
jgi:hypothetical protein